MNLASFLGIEWENFFQDYFEKDSIPGYYIPSHWITKSKLNDPKYSIQVPRIKRIVIVNCIPPYLESSTSILKPGLRSLDKHFRYGYLMDFSKFESADEYLKTQFSSKKLRDIKRITRRLSTNNSVRFESYFGNIDKQNYEALMNCLKNMIQERFGDRAYRHSLLKRWEEHMYTAYEMINERKASLFVFYYSGQPVCIGLSYLRNRVMYGAINSFDQEFGKYGITKILLIEKIKWCFEHDYKGLDLGWGDLPYKKKLVNKVYNYKTQIIYRDNSFLNKAIAQLIGYFLQKKYQMSLLLKS